MNIILCFIFVIPVLIILATFKNDNYPDYLEYVKIFNEVRPTFVDFFKENREIHGEYGYLALNALVKYIGGDYTVVSFLMAFFSISLTIVFFYKKSDDYMFPCLIYISHTFILREMIQIRAGLACAILLYSIKYVYKRNFFSFSFICLLASSFHLAAISFFLVYFAYNWYLKTKHKVHIIIVSIILGIIIDIEFISYIVNAFFPIPGLVEYLNYGEYSSRRGLLNVVLIKNILLYLVLLKYKPFYKDNTQKLKEEEYQTWMLCLFIGIIISYVFNAFQIVAGRAASYFSIFEPLLVVILFRTSVGKINFLRWGVLLIYPIILFFSKYEMIKDYITQIF
ncbi:MAG: EpsG family protein [Chitinophagaceae bacterium]|nr:EpsG family protein [Chitinophagaceae bacterium]